MEPPKSYEIIDRIFIDRDAADPRKFYSSFLNFDQVQNLDIHNTFFPFSSSGPFYKCSSSFTRLVDRDELITS
jgi:hypothetical protein